jgi:hypothetical protein
VKAATRDLTLAFLQSLPAPDQPTAVNKSANDRSLASWHQQYAPLLAVFEQVVMGN